MVNTLSETYAHSFNARVLVVCDDLETGRIWAHSIRQRGWEVDLVTTAEEALHHWAELIPDLIVIDMSTQQLDGIELCRQLRLEAVVPIVILTPRTNEAHILEAYQAGADECFAKPISPALFLAKVRAWLRRTWTVPAEALDSLQAGDLRLDPARRVVEVKPGTIVRLTNLEFRLLHLMMSHAGWTLETGVLIERVWGFTGNGDNTLLKNVVYRLRRKLEPDPSKPRYILTVSGVGYKFQN